MSLSRKQKKCILALNALKDLYKLYVESEAEKKRNDRKRKKFCMSPFLSKINNHDIVGHLLKDVLLEDGSNIKHFCPITVDTFETLLALVEPAINRHDQIRYTINTNVKLAIALRYIATGDSFRALEFLTHISRKKISSFIPKVLLAINDSLNETLKVPTTQNEWLQIAKEFDLLWDFPHTLGALEGKHIRIKSPPHSGSDFYNYNGFFSVVLLSAVDAFGKFLFIDVAANGRATDSVVFKNSSFYHSLKSGDLNIPLPDRLRGQEEKTPYFLIADDIFPLDTNIMKGFDETNELTIDEEVLNSRLNRARLIAHITFGRLTTRFRLFHRSIEIGLSNCDVVIKACCVLHNYLTGKNLTINIEEAESWIIPETIAPLTKQDYNVCRHSDRYRDNLCQYLVTN